MCAKDRSYIKLNTLACAPWNPPCPPHRCEWLCCDFFHAAPTLRADVVFMSPPWGGPNYSQSSTFDVFAQMPAMGVSLARLLEVALSVVAPCDGVVAVFLPRNTNLVQLASLVSTSQ